MFNLKTISKIKQLKGLFIAYLLMSSLSLSGQKIQLLGATSLEKEDLVKVKMHLGFQKRFLEKIGVSQDQQRIIRLAVYDDFLNYSQVLKGCCRQNPTATGFYATELDQINVFKNEEFEFTYAHELVHALTKASRIDQIPWLREGLADYLGAFYWLPNGELNRRNIYPADQLNLNLSKRQLAGFIEASEAEWAKRSTIASYGLAWALISFLHDEKRPFFIQLIQKLDEGESQMQVFDAYPGGFKKFAKEFRTYYEIN